MGFSLFISIYKNSKPIVKTYDETGDPLSKSAYFIYSCHSSELKDHTFKFCSCQNGMVYSTVPLTRTNLPNEVWAFKLKDNKDQMVDFHFMDYTWKTTDQERRFDSEIMDKLRFSMYTAASILYKNNTLLF